MTLVEFGLHKSISQEQKNVAIDEYIFDEGQWVIVNANIKNSQRPNWYVLQYS